MKIVKQLTSALTLTLFVTLTTMAGEIHIPGPPPPPPQSVTTNGDIHIPGEIQLPGTSNDPVVDVALNVLQQLLLVL